MSLRALYLLLLPITLFSCSGNTTKIPADTVSVQNTGAKQANERKIVAADEQKLLDKLILEEMTLFGKEVKTEYTKIQQLLAAEIPGMMNVLAREKAVIKGSYYIVLFEEPQQGKATRVFIGIPIKTAVKAAGYQMLQTTAGAFIRAQVSTEPGQGLVNHQNIRSDFQKHSLKTGFPILETYAETRNSDMTTVISKATFYYPLTK